MCESKDDVLVTAEEWAAISYGLQTAIAANFKLLAERTELRKQLAEATHGEWREALRRVTALAERNICSHEETYRGGAIWEICSSCGAKWADDEGGKPEFVEPTEITEAHRLLATGPAISGQGDGWEAMRQLHRELIAKANDCEAGGRLQDLHLFAAEKIKKVLAEAVK